MPSRVIASSTCHNIQNRSKPILIRLLPRASLPTGYATLPQAKPYSLVGWAQASADFVWYLLTWRVYGAFVPTLDRELYRLKVEANTNTRVACDDEGFKFVTQEQLFQTFGNHVANLLVGHYGVVPPKAMVDNTTNSGKSPQKKTVEDRLDAMDDRLTALLSTQEELTAAVIALSTLTKRKSALEAERKV